MFQKEIDPRIKDIIYATSLCTIESILISLEHIKLVEPIPGNDWQLSGDLTQEGLDQIVDATHIGITHLFKQARINLPSYLRIDENNIANSLIEDAGLPIIRKIQINELEIKFVGPQPLIKQINSYLDPQKIFSKHVKHIELNPIALIFESPDYLN